MDCEIPRAARIHPRFRTVSSIPWTDLSRDHKPDSSSSAVLADPRVGHSFHHRPIAWWMFKQVWPERPRGALITSLFILIFPGYSQHWVALTHINQELILLSLSAFFWLHLQSPARRASASLYNHRVTLTGLRNLSHRIFLHDRSFTLPISFLPFSRKFLERLTKTFRLVALSAHLDHQRSLVVLFLQVRCL